MSIKPFKHYAIENPVFTIYDEESMTVLQLCGRLGGKVNEIIKVLDNHGISIEELVTAFQTTDNRLLAIAETLGELVVEPLGFATPQMFGAVGDGVADDTQAINAAVNALRDHNAVLYFPPGTYLVSEDINLRSNMKVAGSGKRSIIKRASTDQQKYRVFRCDILENVHISDLTVMGDASSHLGDTGEWGMCISLEGSTNVTIERCTLSYGWGDGVYVGSYEVINQKCSNVLIRDCVVEHNRRNGISVINVDGLTVDNCLFRNNKGTEPGAGIDFEPNNAEEGVYNVKVCNSTFEGNGKDVLFADTVNNLYFNKYAIFTGCVFKSQGGLDWRTPLNEAYNTANADCFVRFDGCQFLNSYRGIRITKGAWDSPLTFTGCDFTCTNIPIEIGESGKDYTGYTLGGVSLLNCRVHKTGNNPVVRCVGSNASFANITADLHVNKSIQSYGYFSGNAENVHLDFHEGLFQTSVSQTFDKYKVPSTIYLPNTTTNVGSLVLADNFPKGQVIRVINDSQMDEVLMETSDDEATVPAGISHFTITPSGYLCKF